MSVRVKSFSLGLLVILGATAGSASAQSWLAAQALDPALRASDDNLATGQQPAQELPASSDESTRATTPLDPDAPRPGHSLKVAGLLFIGAGVVVTATGIVTARDGATDNTTTMLLASGIGITLLGVFTYKRGIDAYNNSFLPKRYVAPMISSNQVGLAVGGRF